MCATSHKIKEKYLKKLSADYIVSLENFIPEVKKIFPLGVSYAIDMMGGDVWTNMVKVLAKNAKMVFCATTLDGNGSVDIAGAFFRQISLIGSYGGTVNDLREIIKLFTQRKIKPIIDSTYSLTDASKALEKLRSQKTTGKILLEI